jgi:hypothetical protein
MPSRAILTEVQTISNAEIVQALDNLKIVATSGITSTFPATASTLAGLSVANTFTANQAFSGTISLVATTATAGQILQAGTRVLHTYGTNNLFVGSAAGKISGTIGSGNVSLGRDSMTSLTSGSNNTCLGDQSGYFITSGSSNMLMGSSAGVGISTGSQNIAIGVAALRFIVGNGDCTAIGHQALYSTTGAKNTGIGSNACWTCTSGTKNTFIGEYSGASTDTIGGLTGIGITTGSNNTMLGQNTASTTAAGTYRTAIGSDSRCQNNNAIKLGRDENDVVILPSMTTTQRNAYATPVGGSLIFNVTTGKLNFWNSTAATPAWEAVTSA